MSEYVIGGDVGSSGYKSVLLNLNTGEIKATVNIPYEITGFLPHEEALKHLAILDVMVLPRKRTPTTEAIIPLKVIEAWALGIPVIITKHEVFTRTHIKDREHVVYCEPEPSNIANAILLVLKNEEIKKRLSKNGPKLAERFRYDKIADRLLKAINICTSDDGYK